MVYNPGKSVFTAFTLQSSGSLMASKTFAIRLSEEVIAGIRKRYPGFDTSSAKQSCSDSLRELIELGLGHDPHQATSHELTELKQQVRDLHRELSAIRRNFSTILQIILRNASNFPREQVEATIERLKERGKIV
jgi:hypothetical protein